MNTQKSLLEQEKKYLEKMIEEEQERIEHYIRHFVSAKKPGKIESWRARVELLLRAKKHLDRVWNKI